MANVVNVGQILDEQKTGLAHIRIVVLCFLMLFLDGIDNLGIAYVAPALSEAWHLGRGALGPVFTAGVAGATLYPTDIRSTGVNWAHGVARILSTVAPLLGGILLASEWPLQNIFLLFAVPLFAACGAIFVLQSVVHARDKARRAAVPAGQSAAA